MILRVARPGRVALALVAFPFAGIVALALTPIAGPSREAVASLDGAGPLVLSTSPLPRRLSETGLYRADGSIDPRNLPFAPQYPLWTDGATKRRWVSLPAGAVIDASDLDAWRFPPGTTFWKEFAWEGRRVETRMIRRGLDGTWSFASYVWNEEQTDAVLAPDAGIPGAFALPAFVAGASGRRHSIPGTGDCVACHGSSPSVVLGFDALQLSDDRDPMAPHAEPLPRGAVTLASLTAAGRLAPARPELVSSPPRVHAADPVERAALGYLSANCGGCHNDRGPLARLGFSLRHGAGGGAVPAAVATAVATHGRFVVPGVAPESSYVIAPGAPGRSAVVARMRSRRAASQMPPLGTAVVDTAAVSLVTRWVTGLARAQEPVAVGGPRVR